MAEGGLSVDQFSCPVCLDLLKEPVAIPCGHSYCKVCINDCWDQEDLKGVYSCPQCRRSFRPRPVVGKNTMLAEVVEKLRKTELQDVGPACGPAGPGDVECDFCTGRKLKAVKSCLVCLVSFCGTHLQPHYSVPALKNHKLIKASRYLQEQICSQHEKLLEVYCRTDQQCICMLCTMDQHKGHDAVCATAERAEQQKLLLNAKKEYQQKIQEREKELNKLRNVVDSHKRSAQAAVRDTEKIFTELIRCFEMKRSEDLELIRDQEKAAVSRAERVQKQLEEEIAELRRRNSELEELLNTEDHVHFLQSFQSLSDPLASTVFPSVPPVHSFEEVVKSVTALRSKVEELCNVEIKSTAVIDSCELTPDSATVNKPPQQKRKGKQVATHTKRGQRRSPRTPRSEDCVQGMLGEYYGNFPEGALFGPRDPGWYPCPPNAMEQWVQGWETVQNKRGRKRGGQSNNPYYYFY
ncbi:E3 ubiquitin/ISG15 ligase TRIM25-like isoform X2 [Astyanax mexicanus]|uniref:E3 ubiquitin/ISG15 ligase TRIM25-like isoform X2 n=1 Tax=Astyanax mexicanus TaxID=7994 RepID=UPI0020CAED3C|nr:E3 ubiquitin/ISG15 ligase TRIM25-like isoform X2 [Astyanax mexicanus]